MKKFLVSLLVVAVVGGGIAWFKRTDILLAMIKHKSATEYEIAENRKFHGSTGPLSQQ